MITIAAFYQFAPFDAPAAIQGPLTGLCKRHRVKGTIVLAREGVNGTIAGNRHDVAAVLDHLRTLPGCAGVDVKYSHAHTMPFLRMKVRVKNEIVTLGIKGIDPARDVGRYVDPAHWNAVITDPDTVLIDTRKDFEVAIGTFKGAVNPGIPTFRDFPAWFREFASTLPDKPRIAMFCTGGIRCEKSTAFLRAQGIEDVAHLKGGILSYLETVPREKSLWEGECFVFDDRVSVGHGLAPGSLEQCRACRLPVNATDRASLLFVDGVQCPACASTRTNDQRTGYAERQKQVALATARGDTHLGDR